MYKHRRHSLVPSLAIILALSALALAAFSPEHAQAQEVDQTLSCSASWARPTQRENGLELPLEEIGGYEVRVTPPGGEPYEYLIEDPSATGITIESCVPGEYLLQAAVFDTNGLYSQFVNLSPTAGGGSRPGALPEFEFKDSYPDPLENCTGNCTVLDFSSRLIIRSTDN